MGKFQSYLEWLPERFEQAKKEGKLDYKKEYPKWFKTQLRYGLVKNYKKMKDVTAFNSEYVGIIATTSTVYLFDRKKYYHEQMLVTLMDEGVLPMKQEYLDYERWPISKMPFVCLEYKQHVGYITLSVAYFDDTLFKKDMVNKFMPIIKQMSVPFKRTQDWDD